MNVDTMRTIDYWVGVPLCFLSSILLAPFMAWKKPAKPRKVLFIELSEMGSAILADPAMRKIQRQTGGSLFFVIFTKNKPSLGLLDTVPDDNIFTIREDGLVPLLIDTFRFLVWTRKHRIDTVIDLELFSRFTALMTGYSGAVNRVGFHAFHNEGLYRGSMLTHRVLYNPHIHVAKNFIALVNAALSDKLESPYSKATVPDSEIELHQAELSQENVQQILTTVRSITQNQMNPGEQKIILINANASEMLIQRRWMPENYVNLVRMILSRHSDSEVLLTGAPSESEETEELRRRVDHPRCHNSAGCFTLEQLPSLYSISHLMVTNDSGPGHFSAITDLAVFVLFGPETPELYKPLGANTVAIYKGLACSPCVNAANHRKTGCLDNQCLKQITVDEVYRTIEPALTRSSEVMNRWPGLK